VLVEELFLRTNVSLERILTNERFSRSYSYERTFLLLVSTPTDAVFATKYHRQHFSCDRWT